MARHDDLLQQGPQTAPEPETAEARTRRVGRRGLAGGAVAGGAAAAKFGALKLLLWFFAIRSAFDLVHLGLWLSVVLLLAVVSVAVALRARRSG
jgi:hypothetical protein